MLGKIVEKIKERLETIDDLVVEYDIRQGDKIKAPIAVINIDSESPLNKPGSWKRYTSNVAVTIELIHTSFLDLLSLTESVESALDFSRPLEGTIGWDYRGWTKTDAAIGSNVYGTQLSLVVTHVKVATS